MVSMGDKTTILISKNGLEKIKKGKVKYQAEIGKDVSLEDYILAKLNL